MNPLRLIPKRLLPRNAWGDREACRRRFTRMQGRPPELRKPQRLTDRLYRLKVNGSFLDPLCQFVTDKELAKQYIEQTVGPDYVLETYSVLAEEDEARRFVPDRLPCVVKPTHLSGPVLFCTDSPEDPDRAEMASWLKRGRYITTREANYRYLRPKVIVEEFFSDDSATVPKDYKLFCFGGAPKMIQVDSDRFGAHTQNFYDLDWNRLPITFGVPTGPEDDERPRLLDEMLRISARLSSPFPFVRVDLYASETDIKAGELTLCPRGVNDRILPVRADIELARLFDPDYRLDAKACAEAWGAG